MMENGLERGDRVKYFPDESDNIDTGNKPYCVAFVSNVVDEENYVLDLDVLLPPSGNSADRVIKPNVPYGGVAEPGSWQEFSGISGFSTFPLSVESEKAG